MFNPIWLLSLAILWYKKLSSKKFANQVNASETAKYASMLFIIGKNMAILIHLQNQVGQEFQAPD